MKYIAYDEEMCESNRGIRTSYPYGREIIQIGAVKMDENYKIIDTFSRYVHPIYGKMTKFIQNLTGIHGGNIKDAKTLPEVLREFLLWIGDEDYRLYTWSDTDRDQIIKETNAKRLEIEGLEEFLTAERWIDYQKVFGERFGFEQPKKLSDALDMADIDRDGRLHDGLSDAHNTALLIAALETHPDFKLNYEMICAKEDADPLTISMGSLFSEDIQRAIACA